MNDPVLNDLARYDRELEQSDRWRDLVLKITDLCDHTKNEMGNIRHSQDQKLAKAKSYLHDAIEFINMEQEARDEA